VSLYNELKRRKVFKVGIGYVLIAWLIAQVLQLVFESFGTPDWMIKTALVILISGLPFALFFAWAFEMTPEGLKRDRDVHQPQPITRQTIKKLRDSSAAETQLFSVIYKSRCKGLANWDLLESILTSSTSNNPKHDITGILVATQTHFLQVLEGEFEAINETLERISRDTRHEKVQLMRFIEIEERVFKDWGMHGIGLFDLNSELAVELGRKYGEDNGNVRFPSSADEALELLDMLLSKAPDTKNI
jgi:hypothetical protein